MNSTSSGAGPDDGTAAASTVGGSLPAASLDRDRDRRRRRCSPAWSVTVSVAV